MTTNDEPTSPQMAPQQMIKVTLSPTRTETELVLMAALYDAASSMDAIEHLAEVRSTGRTIFETASEDPIVAAQIRELRGHLDASFSAAERALAGRIPRLLQSAEWAERDFRWILETENPVSARVGLFHFYESTGVRVFASVAKSCGIQMNSVVVFS